jgi:hypothetical protein
VFPKSVIIRIYFTLLIIVLFLSGCGTGSGEQPAAQNEEGTPIPTPTRDPSGYQAGPSQSCQIADWPTMQSDKPQGDLIAWQPGTDNLAYMSPAERSSWYIGDLMLAKGPEFTQRIPLATGVLASGDLTWSPSGSRLAFLAFRPNENVYTVMIVNPDGSGLADLFTTDQARTDQRTSQKAIIGWKGEDTLQVMSSCGEECRQSFDIRMDAAAGVALVPTPVVNYHDLSEGLQLHRKEQTIDPAKFPKILTDPKSKPNWSPDNQMIAYLDKRGLLWMLSIPKVENYMLDIGLRDVAETQWAADNHYLAIRAEDRIFAFQVPCEKPMQ